MIPGQTIVRDAGAGTANVLLVEDNPGDARLISEMLHEVNGERFRLKQADRLASGLECLDRGDVGVVLLDLSLPDSLGIDTFARVYAHAPEVPIIVLTGTDDEVLALNAVKTGAQDYLIKGRVDSGLLIRAMRYAMERKTAEKSLRESEERYALAAAGANDGLWDWRLHERRIYFSPRWKAMLGYAEHEIGDRPDEWLGRIHADDNDKVRQQLDHHIQGISPHFQCEYRIRMRDGSYRWMLCRGIAVRDRKAAAHRMAGSQTDIHERKLAEEQLLYDALHDALTGLPNRILLMDRLGHALEQIRRDPEKLCAVLFIDLDRFKNVNDSLGHLAGDQLLVECAHRLTMHCRPGDSLARWGGDEFVLLLEDIDGVGDATGVAERIQKQFGQPFEIQGNDLFIAASIGIVLGSASYTRPEELLRDADNAMYTAKARGKACYSVFDASMRSQTTAFLRMETDLRRAIKRQDFQVYYQPVVALDTGAISGFEALLRWRHAERGLIHPADFIPLAEETNLILEIGEWVLREACRQMKVWNNGRGAAKSFTVSVNVSSKQFSQDGIVEMVAAILHETGLPGTSLTLEMTESVIMENAEKASHKLNRLRDMGVSLSMDDFGTGYSSLSYLHRFPVDTLKIDQSFVRRILETAESVEIVRAIVSLAKSLNLAVIAEGIETTVQAEALRSMGCGYGQGNFFSPALPRARIDPMLRGRGLRGHPAA